MEIFNDNTNNETLSNEEFFSNDEIIKESDSSDVFLDIEYPERESEIVDLASCEETENHEDEYYTTEIILGTETEENCDEKAIEKTCQDSLEEEIDVCEQPHFVDKTLENIKEAQSQFDGILCENKVSVYAKVNAEGFITAVDSDIFLKNVDGWIKIAEGVGERFVHAQSSYFEEPLRDDDGRYRYKK